MRYSSDPTQRGDDVAYEMRDYYEANRPLRWWEKRNPPGSWGCIADDLMLELRNIVLRAELEYRAQSAAPTLTADDGLDNGARTAPRYAAQVVREHDPGRHGLIQNLERLADYLDAHRLPPRPADDDVLEVVARALEEAWLARGYGEGDQWNYLARAAVRAVLTALGYERDG